MTGAVLVHLGYSPVNSSLHNLPVTEHAFLTGILITTNILVYRNMIIEKLYTF
jgi:hypothetical protein